MSTSPPTTAVNPSGTPSIASAIEKLRDFPDRLSPIVVKELRQGLRQPSFVILFLFLQGVLAMVVAGALFGASGTNLEARLGMGGMISGFFFGLFSLAVLLVQPLRGLNALASETRGGTIDLLLLTRLDAWRITFGKWLSLTTQSALLLVAMLPYLMMRYFLGGMQLFDEVLWLLLLFFLGTVVCAGAVGLSSIRSLIIRGVVAVIVALGFLIVPQFVVLLFAFGGTGVLMGASGWWNLGLTPLQSAAGIGGILLGLTFLAYACLEFGATRIAPPAENRSARKRLISLGALIVIPGLFLLTGSDARILSVAAIALIGSLAIADALSESPYFTSPSRHRLLHPFLPGWPSGAIFGSLLTLIAMGLVIFSASLIGINDSFVPLGVVAISFLIVTQPALIVAIFRSQERQPATAYIAILLGSCAIGLVIFMVAAAAGGEELFATLAIPAFPVVGFFAFAVDDYPDLAVITATSFLALYLVVIAMIGRARWPQPNASLPDNASTDPPGK